MPNDEATALRILDANFNRCCEGLRVVEEYLRFVLEDPHLATECKEIRHAVTMAVAPLGIERLSAARDAEGDVGATIGTETEYRRETVFQVAAASMKRVEQALRTMEEYSKLVSSEVVALLEPLRYRSYTLEKAIHTTRRRLHQLKDARIYVLLDGRAATEEFSDLATELIQSGADIIQLRDKFLPDRALLQRAHCLRSLTSGSQTLFWIPVCSMSNVEET